MTPRLHPRDLASLLTLREWIALCRYVDLYGPGPPSPPAKKFDVVSLTRSFTRLIVRLDFGGGQLIWIDLKAIPEHAITPPAPASSSSTTVNVSSSSPSSSSSEPSDGQT